MTELPDFLQLSEEQTAAEKDRQDRLRRDFANRVRMKPSEIEFARASILERDLKEAFGQMADGENKDATADQLAEILAAQGRFLEALKTVKNKDQKKFYKQAADAVYKPKKNECKCEPEIKAIDGQTRVRLPKYRVIKEIYNFKKARFGFLVECNTCAKWRYFDTDPTAVPAVPISDLELLKA